MALNRSSSSAGQPRRHEAHRGLRSQLRGAVSPHQARMAIAGGRRRGGKLADSGQRAAPAHEAQRRHLRQTEPESEERRGRDQHRPRRAGRHRVRQAAHRSQGCLRSQTHRGQAGRQRHEGRGPQQSPHAAARRRRPPLHGLARLQRQGPSHLDQRRGPLGGQRTRTGPRHRHRHGSDADPQRREARRRSRRTRSRRKRRSRRSPTRGRRRKVRSAA